MKLPLSVIKAGIGSAGGHAQPRRNGVETVRSFVIEQGRDLLIDGHVS